MGLSEYLYMRALEKEATDIRETLRNNHGRLTADSAKSVMKYDRDDYGNKNYGKARGSKEPTLTAAQQRILIKRAKKVERDLEEAKKKAKKEKEAKKNKP